MKIATFGTKKWYSAQLDRIDNGFTELGHEITSGAANLIYANDPGGFDAAIQHKINFGGRLVLNIQDRPIHCPNVLQWDSKIREKLLWADKVTSISKYTQSEVLKIGFSSQVIYQPIKPIYPVRATKDVDFFMAGRLRDANKRASIAWDLMRLPENLDKIFATAGDEPPGFGIHLGVLTDLQLNFAFNRSKVTFCFGKIEGLGLTLIESLAAGTPAIVLSDCTTAAEFAPPEMISEPKIERIQEKIIDILGRYDYYVGIASEFGQKYRELFSPKQIALNIIEAAYA